jgi:hypothetical protein
MSAAIFRNERKSVNQNMKDALFINDYCLYSMIIVIADFVKLVFKEGKNYVLSTRCSLATKIGHQKLKALSIN